MTLTPISKHCLITATLALIVCLVALIGEFETLRKEHVTAKEEIVPSDNEEFSELKDHHIQHYRWIFVAGAAISCILTIVGVVRRFALFMVPFYLFAFGGLVIAAIELTMVVAFTGGVGLIGTKWLFGSLAVFFVIVNPFFAVFGEIRQEHSVKRKQNERV